MLLSVLISYVRISVHGLQYLCSKSLYPFVLRPIRHGKRNRNVLTYGTVSISWLAWHNNRRTESYWRRRVLERRPRLGKRSVGHPGRVNIWARRLAGAECGKPRIKPSAVQLKRPMTSSGLQWLMMCYLFIHYFTVLFHCIEIWPPGTLRIKKNNIRNILKSKLKKRTDKGIFLLFCILSFVFI